MWTIGLEGGAGFSILSFTAHLHVCSWTFFTFHKKWANTSSSSSPSFLPVSLLYVSLPALLLQMNAASSAFCGFLLFLLVWQLLAPLNTCLCKSSFSLQNSPSTDVLLLSVAHHSVPLSMYLFLRFTPLCVSNLCSEKCSAALPMDNCEKEWKLWRRWHDKFGDPPWQTWSNDLLLVPWTSPGLIVLAPT